MVPFHHHTYYDVILMSWIFDNLSKHISESFNFNLRSSLVLKTLCLRAYISNMTQLYGSHAFFSQQNDNKILFFSVDVGKSSPLDSFMLL